MFAPYVDMQKIRMVHLGLDFEEIPNDVGCMVVERYDGQLVGKSTPFEWEIQRSDRSMWSLTGRNLARDSGDVFRFVGVAGDGEIEVAVSVAPVERWVLRRVEL